MTDLKPPLGLDEKIKKNNSRSALFLKLMTQNMPSYADHTLYEFSDVLDNITLIYAIRNEIEKQVTNDNENLSES